MVFQRILNWLFQTETSTEPINDWLTLLQAHLQQDTPDITFREFLDVDELFQDLRDSGYGGEIGQVKFYFENPRYLAEDFGVDAVSVIKEYLYGIRLIEHSPSTEVYQGKRFFTDNFLLLDILVRRERYRDHLEKLNSKC